MNDLVLVLNAESEQKSYEVLRAFARKKNSIITVTHGGDSQQGQLMLCNGRPMSPAGIVPHLTTCTRRNTTARPHQIRFHVQPCGPVDIESRQTIQAKCDLYIGVFYNSTLYQMHQQYMSNHWACLACLFCKLCFYT